MANIKPYLDHISSATYGEEVRGSLINALSKVNDDNESYQQIKKDIVEINDSFQEKVSAATTVKKELVESTRVGNESRDELNNSIASAIKENTSLGDTINAGKTLESTLPDLIDTAGASKAALQGVVTDSVNKKTELDVSVNEARGQLSDLTAVNTTATKTYEDLVKSNQEAENTKGELDDSISTAVNSRTQLENTVATAANKKTELETSIGKANTSKNELDASINEAEDHKTELDKVITMAEVTESSLNKSVTAAISSKEDLDIKISQAGESNEELTKSIASSVVAKTELETSVESAVSVTTGLNESVVSANGVLQSLDSENSSAASNLEELRSENFNSQEILAGVADLRAYLGLADEDILGVQVDYKNKTFTRIAGAVNLTSGADFDRFSMFGGRRRCNVADDGTINAWYGDEGYTEDGGNGQVMVYQPKFYYLVCPVVYDPIDTGIGYHLRKANYYVSEKPRAGFRLHPAFYDAAGNEIDYFLDSSYEGSIWDADGGDGTGAYLLNDEQLMSTGADKFCSIADARPATGSSQSLTRPNIEQMAQNRGTNWHSDLIKQTSARQLLMLIEMGMMNLQTAIGQGVVTLPWETGTDKVSSYAAKTGSTAPLGNGTGQAASTVSYPGNVETTYTEGGKTSITWRGTENPWGNVWKFVYGVNFWGNGAMGGGQPYICNDFNFAESKNSDNYEGAGFTIANANGYISGMGYSTKCDYLFIASETLGNSSLPVGDYTYVTENLSGYRIARLGGGWADGGNAGAFCWRAYGVGGRYRAFGGRLVYIPTKDSAVYNAAIESWKQQMAA